MAANTTGHRQTDHLRIMALAEAAAQFAREVLAQGGVFLCKVLQGGTEANLLAELKRDFESVKARKTAGKPYPNLAGDSGEPLEIRLRGAKGASYTLKAQESGADSQAVQNYVATAPLPGQISPGLYSISVHREGLGWISLPDQQLEVRPDPPTLPVFSIEDPAYGGCHPDDGSDDSSCFARAIEAAGRAGGGVVQIPPGHWDVSTVALGVDGFLIPHNVHLRGAGSRSSFVLRHGAVKSRGPDALLTLTGHNSVVDLSFSDELRFQSTAQARPVIQLGALPVADESSSGASHLVEDIVISNNVFLHVGCVMTDVAGRPVERLIVTANVLGGYASGIELRGNSGVVWEPYRIEDSVIRGNRFVPGSYIDLSIKQGVLASEMGTAQRMDFSANIVDGTSTENLQEPDDPPGFRAAFFWDSNNSVERLLVAENQISCSGDKVGDGEAVSLDESGDTYGFNGTPTIVSAGADWIVVRGKLNPVQAGRRPRRINFPAIFAVTSIELEDSQKRGRSTRTNRELSGR